MHNQETDWLRLSKSMLVVSFSVCNGAEVPSVWDRGKMADVLIATNYTQTVGFWTNGLIRALTRLAF